MISFEVLPCVCFETWISYEAPKLFHSRMKIKFKLLPNWLLLSYSSRLSWLLTLLLYFFRKYDFWLLYKRWRRSGDNLSGCIQRIMIHLLVFWWFWKFSLEFSWSQFSGRLEELGVQKWWWDFCFFWNEFSLREVSSRVKTFWSFKMRRCQKCVSYDL